MTEILNNSDARSFNPTYVAGNGPVSISVVDPVKIPQGDYTLKLFNPEFSGTSIISYNNWELSDQNSGNVIGSSNQSLLVGSEKYVEPLRTKYKS